MYSIIRRILGQMRNDKRTMALLIVAPIFILTLLYFILGDSDYVPHLGVYQIPKPMIEQIKEDVIVTETDTLPVPETYISKEGLDGFLWMDADGMHIYMKEQNSKTIKLLKSIQNASTSSNQMMIAYQYETNQDNQLDSLSYVFLGILSFFIVFILSGMSFVGERLSQTLERMLMAPLSRTAVIGGYTLGYGILATLQSMVIILFTAFVLKLHFEGSVLLCMVVMIIMAFAAVSTGALFSLFANNEFQMVQFIPVIIIPQIFFSGLIPLDTIPFGLGNLCYIAPAYYGCTALQHIMIYGESIDKIWPWMLGLLIYIAILFFLNVQALKKYRRL